MAAKEKQLEKRREHKWEKDALETHSHRNRVGSPHLAEPSQIDNIEWTRFEFNLIVDLLVNFTTSQNVDGETVAN